MGAVARIFYPRGGETVDPARPPAPCPRCAGVLEAQVYAFETWEQLDGEVPAWMIHPSAGGLGVTATWKGWNELNALGWAQGVPRMVVASSSPRRPRIEATERRIISLCQSPDFSVERLKALYKEIRPGTY